jgi:hypothetical protein
MYPRHIARSRSRVACRQATKSGLNRHRHVIEKRIFARTAFRQRDGDRLIRSPTTGRAIQDEPNAAKRKELDQTRGGCSISAGKPSVGCAQCSTIVQYDSAIEPSIAR